MSQECKHEADIAVLKADIPEIKEDVKAILKIVQGDNGEGLVTRVSVLKARQKIQWWFIGGISMCILTGAFFVIRAAVAG